MFFKRLYLLISLVLIATYIEEIHSKKPVSNDLRSPININTSKVVPLTSVKPLTIYLEEHGLEKLENTGKEIIIYPLPFARTSVTGGPLKPNNLYRIYRNLLDINQNPEGRSGSAINGKGYPVTGINVFINVRYKTYEDAVKRDDGFVVISELVKVNSTSNPKFEPLGEILRSGKLKKPNSFTITPDGTTYGWYSTFAISHSYYTYRGSFYNPETKKQISNVTHIVTHPPYNHISYEQFEAFKNVLEFDGEPIKTITPIFPQKNRRVETSNVVQLVQLPFSGIIFLLQITYLFFFGPSTPFSII